jgi:hypothetical protein
MDDRETPPMRKYGESETTRIMVATVPHVTFGYGLRKIQAVDIFRLSVQASCLGIPSEMVNGAVM